MNREAAGNGTVGNWGRHDIMLPGYGFTPMAVEPQSPAEYRRTAEHTKGIAARTDDAALRRLRLQIAMTLFTLATEVEKLAIIKLSMPFPPSGPPETAAPQTPA